MGLAAPRKLLPVPRSDLHRGRHTVLGEMAVGSLKALRGAQQGAVGLREEVSERLARQARGQGGPRHSPCAGAGAGAAPLSRLPKPVGPARPPPSSAPRARPRAQVWLRLASSGGRASSWPSLWEDLVLWMRSQRPPGPAGWAWVGTARSSPETLLHPEPAAPLAGPLGGGSRCSSTLAREGLCPGE